MHYIFITHIQIVIVSLANSVQQVKQEREIQNEDEKLEAILRRLLQEKESKQRESKSNADIPKGEVETAKKSVVKQAENIQKEEVETAKKSVVRQSETIQKEDVETAKKSVVRQSETIQKEDVETAKKSVVKQAENIQKEDVETEKKSVIKQAENIQKKEAETIKKPVVKQADRREGHIKSNEHKLDNAHHPRKLAVLHKLQARQNMVCYTFNFARHLLKFIPQC